MSVDRFFLSQLISRHEFDAATEWMVGKLFISYHLLDDISFTKPLKAFTEKDFSFGLTFIYIEFGESVGQTKWKRNFIINRIDGWPFEWDHHILCSLEIDDIFGYNST